MAAVSPLTVGAKAPNFAYREADGTARHTRELKGRPYLVYFYPRDDTPGCTTEACGFRDAFAEFAAAGLTIIGVSGDSEQSHEKFRRKHALPFALAADTDCATAKAYGVWGEKKFMGKTFDGIHRVSVLVGRDGQVAKVYPKVKPEAHAAEVLADVRQL